MEHEPGSSPIYGTGTRALPCRSLLIPYRREQMEQKDKCNWVFKQNQSNRIESNRIESIIET